jgi:hypothetical protein
MGHVGAFDPELLHLGFLIQPIGVALADAAPGEHAIEYRADQGGRAKGEP